MGVNMKNSGQFEFKNVVIVLLIVLLCISTGFLIKYGRQLGNGNIIGTYSVGELADIQYFVFKGDNYYKYKNQTMVEKGIYKKDYEDMYVLEDTDGEKHCIVYSKNVLYYFDTIQNYVIQYKKIDSRPVLMGNGENVSD